MSKTTPPKAPAAKAAMKTFLRHRTLNELQAECTRRFWQIDTARFDRDGSDYVRVHWSAHHTVGTMLVSMVNGRFFGSTVQGIEFSSDSTAYEGKRWFQALLDTVYLPLPQKAGAGS